jgi:hypothetical protein
MVSTKFRCNMVSIRYFLHRKLVSALKKSLFSPGFCFRLISRASLYLCIINTMSGLVSQQDAKTKLWWTCDVLNDILKRKNSLHKGKNSWQHDPELHRLVTGVVGSWVSTVYSETNSSPLKNLQLPTHIASCGTALWDKFAGSYRSKYNPDGLGQRILLPSLGIIRPVWISRLPIWSK